MVGVNVEKQARTKYVNDEEWDRLHNPHPDQPCYIVDDPMSGQFTVAGIPLSPPGGEYEGLRYTEVDLESVDFNMMKLKVREFCKTEFGIEDAQPKLISFTRWS